MLIKRFFAVKFQLAVCQEEQVWPICGDIIQYQVIVKINLETLMPGDRKLWRALFLLHPEADLSISLICQNLDVTQYTKVVKLDQNISECAENGAVVRKEVQRHAAMTIIPSGLSSCDLLLHFSNPTLVFLLLCLARCAFLLKLLLQPHQLLLWHQFVQLDSSWIFHRLILSDLVCILARCAARLCSAAASCLQ